MRRPTPRPPEPTPAALEATVARLTAQLQAEIDAGGLSTARAADERAAELAGEAEYDLDSDAHTTLTAALCDVAGRAFPGDWEDYA